MYAFQWPQKHHGTLCVMAANSCKFFFSKKRNMFSFNKNVCTFANTPCNMHLPSLPKMQDSVHEIIRMIPQRCKHGSCIHGSYKMYGAFHKLRWQSSIRIVPLQIAKKERFLMLQMTSWQFWLLLQIDKEHTRQRTVVVSG